MNLLWLFYSVCEARFREPETITSLMAVTLRDSRAVDQYLFRLITGCNHNVRIQLVLNTKADSPTLRTRITKGLSFRVR